MYKLLLYDKEGDFMIKLMSLFLSLNTAYAACEIKGGERSNDYLSHLLKHEASCPKSVQELNRLLQTDGIRKRPTMVANRGFHNPQLGSFSIFETLKGRSQQLGRDIAPSHFYFGHFTNLKQGRVGLDQENAKGKLLIEAIAWDFSKRQYNFYELIGGDQGPTWHYRGDTMTALRDNRNLKLGLATPSAMRCSACHNSGGPIMKELEAPHNDWWTRKRGLPLGPNIPSSELSAYMTHFKEAKEFAVDVTAGMDLLQKSSLDQRLSLREQLRPLFCTTEINLVSDIKPLENSTSMQIPSTIFVDPLLLDKEFFTLSKSQYVSLLRANGSRFPETNNIDADHGFLAPVRARVMHDKVKALINRRIIDDEFAKDVLSIDFKTPLFSSKRCDLLKLVPSGGDWRKGFSVNLAASENLHAKELLIKLRQMDGSSHVKQAKDYLKSLTLPAMVNKLNVIRKSVLAEEISKNPRGQILEPGFRIIFPEFRK